MVSSSGIVVVANPAARGGQVAAQLRRLNEVRDQTVGLAWTEKIGDGKRLAFEAARSGCSTVVAAGGDGTVNEVANGLQQAGGTAALGVLPLGTMNVFARELGLPLGRPARAWKIIVARHLRQVDCFYGGGECFVQMGGVGLDAAVVHQTSRRWKRWFGPLSYVWKGVELMQRDAEPLRLRDAEGREYEGAAVLFGNGRYYAGSVAFFPGADNRDGLLDVLVFRQQTYESLVKVLEWIARQRELPEKQAWYLQTRSLSVTSKKPAPYQLDGEWRGETPLEIRLGPVPLSVCVPGWGM